MKKIFTILYFLCAIFTFANTIEFWYYWKGDEETVLINLIKKYEEENNIKIDMKKQNFWGLSGKYSVVAEQGGGPDLLIGPSDWIGKFKSIDAVESIDGYLNNEEKTAFLPKLIEGSEYEGKLYGLPLNYNVVTLWYNKSFLNEAPKNTDDMIKYGKTILNEEKGIYGLVYDLKNYYYQLLWVTGYGGEIIDKNKNTTFDSKEQHKALVFFEDIRNGKNKIMPKDVSYDMAVNMFISGKAAMGIFGSWELKRIYESGVEFDIAVLPIVSETGIYAKPVLAPEIIMLSKKSKNKKEAVKFMKYLVSEFAQEEFLKNTSLIPTRNDIYTANKIKKSKYYHYFEILKKQIDNSIISPNYEEVMIGVWPYGSILMNKSSTEQYLPQNILEEAQKDALKAIKEFRAGEKK